MYMLRSHRITEWMSNVAILEISFKTGDFSNPSELKPSSDYFWISSRICVFRLKLWKHRSPQVFKVCCYFFNQNELDIIYFENQKIFRLADRLRPAIPFLKHGTQKKICHNDDGQKYTPLILCAQFSFFFFFIDFEFGPNFEIFRGPYEIIQGIY